MIGLLEGVYVFFCMATGVVIGWAVAGQHKRSRAAPLVRLRTALLSRARARNTTTRHQDGW